MNERDRDRLCHMLDASREAISFVQGRTKEDLFRDRLLLLAVVKEIEIVGEAASRISSEGRSEAPDIPWPKVIGMRNRLSRECFDWDLEAIWSTQPASPDSRVGTGVIRLGITYPVQEKLACLHDILLQTFEDIKLSFG